MTRAILARIISSVSGVAALACASVREARAVLEVARPDAAIIDLQLGDGLGFEVLEMLDQSGGVSLAIVASAYIGQYAQPIQPAPAPRLHYMEKPLDYGRLRMMIEVLVPEGGLFHGPFSPAEYVQIAGAGRHSVLLACHDSAGARLGAVVVHRGRIWSAETPVATGMDALRDMVLRSDARVRVSSVKEPGPANVDRPWQDAVFDCFESARPQGEEGFDALFESDRPEAAPASIEPESPPLARAADERRGESSVAELTALALRGILRGDYQGALEALARALELEPDNASVRHQLGRLRKLTEKS